MPNIFSHSIRPMPFDYHETWSDYLFTSWFNKCILGLAEIWTNKKKLVPQNFWYQFCDAENEKYVFLYCFVRKLLQSGACVTRVYYRLLWCVMCVRLQYWISSPFGREISILFLLISKMHIEYSNQWYYSFNFSINRFDSMMLCIIFLLSIHMMNFAMQLLNQFDFI